MKNGAPKKPRNRKKSTHTWHLVTNHQNLLYMLAAGMVMGPAGFRSKHYSDPLSAYPGWIPLFRNKVIPASALDNAVSERKHLLPCVASFDLSGLTGPVRMLSRDGNIRNIAIPQARKCKDDIAILTLAPLPLILLFKISFRSPEDMEIFESSANDVSNVDLSPHRIEVVESLFSTVIDVAWPPVQLQGQLFEANADNPPMRGQALGGVLAMLYHIANRSDLGLAAFRLAAGVACDKDSNLVQSDPILAELPNWVDGVEISEQADIRTRLFWGVIQSLITAQTKERPQTPVDVTLEYLNSQLGHLQDMEFRERLERLIADMRSYLGLGGGTITELLERHKGSLSRPLLLFCLREHCVDLLEFSHSLLSDTEYLLAGILFGVRDGWLQLPRELRDPGLSAFVSYRMADIEHRNLSNGFTLEEPQRPIPIRELFVSPNGQWNRTQEDVALEFACDCGWNDCIQTRITLAEGDYPASFERNNLQIVLPGRIMAVTEVVDKVIFLYRLGQWPPISRQMESGIRKKLVGAQEIGEKVNGNGSSCG